MELKHLLSLGHKIGATILLFLAIPMPAVNAQIVPDGTLKSTVETIQELMKIDGGLKNGSNLFHSFEEFNIPEGMEASFENSLEIENIFTRVTGDSASTINGTLSAQGKANLFLMNPNGIVFGQDASINIGGSFIATTADNIQFQDSTEFAATGTEDQTPLLTNEIPIGLGFGSNDGTAGAITLNGNGNEVTPAAPFSPTQVKRDNQGLEVDSGNTLAFAGSGIVVDGGTITSESGNIELGSVDSGQVQIEQTENGFDFNYENITDYQNITLTNQALLDNYGEGTGTINLTGDNVRFENGSNALIQNSTVSESGDINIDAAESISLSGTSPDGGISSTVLTETLLKEGDGGDINVSTVDLSLQDGASISANTYGDGQAGNVTIDASNSVQLLENNFVDTSRDGFIISSIGGATYGSGNAGLVNISTQQIKILDGGVVSSSTFSSGDGGTLNINADSVEVIGIREDVSSNSAITVTSVGTGNAGNLSLNSSTLEVKDGGTVNSSSVSNGNAGNVNVNASESIEVSGATSEIPSSISSSVAILNEVNREAFGLPDVPSGNAGEVTINTSDLSISEGGIVSVRNSGVGNAGTLFINAQNIDLDSNGSIDVSSASGIGGNIELNTLGLQIDDGSQITAEAEGDSGGGNININAEDITAKKNSDISANAEGGDGGNITIDTETLLGLDNSDITANAVEGDGGNINITATSILGFEERPERTPLSDITASSEFGVDGNININSPETNAEEDVQVSAKKPVAPLTPLEFVKGCQLPEGILTTRGRGVPESPYPFPFGRFSYDEDVYKKAEETMRQERLRQQRSERENGISKREAEERRQERELAMLREKQRLLPNRHEHLKYEVTDDRNVGPMLLPAPQGRLVGDPDGRTDKNAIAIFYSQSNELPPISREKRLREEGNVLVINPDGSQHFVRMFLMSHPTEEMCQSTVGRS